MRTSPGCSTGFLKTQRPDPIRRIRGFSALAEEAALAYPWPGMCGSLETASSGRWRCRPVNGSCPATSSRSGSQSHASAAFVPLADVRDAAERRQIERRWTKPAVKSSKAAGSAGDLANDALGEDDAASALPIAARSDFLNLRHCSMSGFPNIAGSVAPRGLAVSRNEIGASPGLAQALQRAWRRFHAKWEECMDRCNRLVDVGRRQFLRGGAFAAAGMATAVALPAHRPRLHPVWRWSNTRRTSWPI